MNFYFCTKAIIIGALCSCLTGCWLTNSFEDACNTNADCASGTCSQGVCVADGDNDGGTDAGDDAVADTSQDTLVVDACETHADCGQTDALTGSQLCVENVCETVLFQIEGTVGCNEIYGELTADPANQVIIPVISSESGSAGIGLGIKVSTNGARFAIDRVNEVGLGDNRKLAAVFCDIGSRSDFAVQVSERIIGATNASATVGPHLGESAIDALRDVHAPNETVLMTFGPAIAYSTIDNEDFGFRIIPSDSLAVTAFVELAKRLNPASINLFYRTDDSALRTYGEALQVALAAEGYQVASAGYEFDPISQESTIDTAVNSITGNLIAPAELVIGISQGELARVGQAYLAAFANDAPAPRIIGSAGAGQSLGDLVAIDPDRLSYRAEAVVGNVLPSEEFQMFYDGNPAAPNPIIDGMLFDAMTVLALATMAADENTGPSVRTALRERVANPDSGTILRGSQPNMVGDASVVFAGGGSIQYRVVSGDIPIEFDQFGDVQRDYITLIGASDAEPWALPAYRTFPRQRGVWLDLCPTPLSTCRQVNGGPQFCTPNNFCLPLCDSANPTCPDDRFTCVADPPAPDLCLPPNPT